MAQADRRTVVISNRPPVGVPSGGAGIVILAGHPIVWIGPKDVADMEDNLTPAEFEKYQQGKYTLYADLPKEDRMPMIPAAEVANGYDTTNVYLFPQPRTRVNQHYAGWSNEVAWPVLHGMDPEEYTGRRNAEIGEKTRAKGLKGQSLMMGITQSKLARDFAGFQTLNRSINDYVDALEAEGKIDPNTIRRVEDYQMPGVRGDIFYSHIPFPPQETIERYRIDVDGKPGETVRLIDTTEWQSYIEAMTLPYKQIGFQRPCDMKNYLDMLAHYDPQFKANNPDLYRGDQIAETPVGMEGARSIAYRGHSLVVLNQVVGTSLEKNLNEALENENTLEKTVFAYKRERQNEYKAGEMDAVQARACGIPDRPGLTLKALLSDRKGPDGDPINLLEDPGHNLFLSFHRNDYTKSSVEKLQAVKDYFQAHPDRIGKDHFVIFAQPTRLTVGGYREYSQSVVALTQELREETEFGYGEKARKGLGDSLLLVPAGVDHADLMGLIRNKNVAAVVSTGKKDGCDLTQDEANHANSDRRQIVEGPNGEPLTLGVPLANVTTDGTGAADKYTGTPEKPIGFIVRACDSQSMREDLKNAFEQISEMRETEEGRHELAVRSGRAMEAAERLSAKHFHDVMNDTYHEMVLSKEPETEPVTRIGQRAHESHGRLRLVGGKQV